MTKSRIFKNLNLREKTDCNFPCTFLKNRSRHLKLYSNPQAVWLEVVVIWAHFERRKIEVHIFERANLSDFGMSNVTAKEDLHRRTQVFLLNFGPWLVQKSKIWSIFYGKYNSIRKFCCLKAWGFKNWYFLWSTWCSLLSVWHSYLVAFTMV